MKQNAVTGIDDENHIRDALKYAGIRGFRRLAGYVPKVLDVDRIEMSIVENNFAYSSIRAEGAINLYTDFCWECLYNSNRFLNEYYGDIEHNPYNLFEPNEEQYCACCGNWIDGIPF